jgi:hypothetical protein
MARADGGQQWTTPLNLWPPPPKPAATQLQDAFAALQKALDDSIANADKGSPTPILKADLLDDAQYKLDRLREKAGRRGEACAEP